MKKLLIASLIFGSMMHAMNREELPSINEVIATGHPLTITLYALRARYSNGLATKPNASDFSSCLKTHGLIRNPWIHEKGFISILKQSKARELSTQEAETDITDYISRHHNLPREGKALLAANLTDAFQECIFLTSDS